MPPQQSSFLYIYIYTYKHAKTTLTHGENCGTEDSKTVVKMNYDLPGFAEFWLKKQRVRMMDIQDNFFSQCSL